MPRLPTIALLPFLALLGACPIDSKEPVDTGLGDDSGTTDSADSGRDSGETGDTGTEALGVPPLGPVLDVVPGTLPLAEGGEVALVLEAVEGADLSPWVGDTAAYTFTPDLDGAGPIAVSAAFEGTSARFVFTVPGGLSPSPLRLQGKLARKGETVTTAPIWLADSTDAAQQALAGTNWQAFDATPQEGSVGPHQGPFLSSTGNSAGGRYDLALSMDGTELVAKACPADGGSCLEHRQEPSKGGGTWVIGHVAHTIQDSFASGHSVVVFDPSGSNAPAVYPYTLDAEKGTLTAGGGVSLGKSALFAVVLGINNTKKEPSQPNLALLLEDEGLFGVVEAGAALWTASSVGEVTPKDVLLGGAFVGVATTTDLSGGANSGTSWWWAAEWNERSQEISLNVALPNAASAGFSRVRDATIEGVSFTVDALTASGEDLDGNGHPELFVEVWGTRGELAIWMVPDATDKSATAPIRSLTTVGSAAVSLPVSRSIIKLRKSTLQGSRGRVIGHQSHPDHWEYSSSHPPDGVWVSTEEWLTAELVDGGKTAVEPNRVGMVGRSKAPLRPSCDLTAERGLCLHGKCFCVAGAMPQGSVVLGEGSGGEIGEPIVAGDDVFYGAGADGGSVVVTRPLSKLGGTHFGALQMWHAMAEEPGATQSGTFSLSIGGGSVVFSDSSTISVLGASSVSSVSGGNLGGGMLRLAVTAGTPDAETGVIQQGLQFEQGGEVVAAALPDDTTVGGTSVPQLLGVQAATGGAFLAWRDGEGQAWMGVIDVDTLMTGSREVPFFEGPFAVGDLIPDVAESAVGAFARQFVAVRQPETAPPSFTDDPLLRMSGFTVSSGDVTFTQNTDPTFFLTEGSSGACGVRTVALPARDSLEAAIADLAVISTGSDSTCADLKLPVTAVGGVAYSPELLVMQTPSLAVSWAWVDADGVVAMQEELTTLTPPGLASSITDMGWWGRISASDVDGDGLSDLVAIDADGPRLFLSDGRGGFGEVTVEAHTATNFALLLTGSIGSDLCEPDGGAFFSAGNSWGMAEPG